MHRLDLGLYSHPKEFFGGMEFDPMLTPREKSPLPEKVPRGGSNPRRCGQRAQALPTELFRPLLSVWCSPIPVSPYTLPPPSLLPPPSFSSSPSPPSRPSPNFLSLSFPCFVLFLPSSYRLICIGHVTSLWVQAQQQHLMLGVSATTAP